MTIDVHSIQAEATKNREWKISRMGNSFVLFTKLLMRIFKFTKACDQKFIYIIIFRVH